MEDEETRDEEVTEDDNREEETRDEIRDNDYANDDEIEMLRTIEDRFSAIETKIDNMISMFVDSGSIVHDVDDIPTENNDDYEDDFIDIDDLDLSI